MVTRVVSAFESYSASDAAKVAAHGGIVVYPTETAYAIGCSAIVESAAKKVFELKRRDLRKPLPVIVASKAMAGKFVRIDPKAELLIDAFMPGPLTLVAAKKGEKVYAGDRSTLAFRISSSVFCREFSALLGAPIVSTSANISSEETVYSIDKALEIYEGKVDLIVSAGDLTVTPTSTIVDVTGTPKIVRKGLISMIQIENALKGRKGSKVHDAKKAKRAGKGKTASRKPRRASK